MGKTRILLVDDQKPVKAEIEKTLRAIGIDPSIDFQMPRQRGWPYGCRFPDDAKWDEYDLALLDLELFYPGNRIEYSEGDLLGGSEVLPFLRRNAPWLPTIAISHLFKTQSDLFLGVAGSFGFDGHLPRDIFQSTSLRLVHWEGIVKRAISLRRRALTGWNNDDGDVVVECDASLRLELDAQVPRWAQLAQLCFAFASKVVLEPMKGGFSGARPLKVYARVPHSPLEGQWVWKVGSPSKLHREAMAHLRLQRAGLSFSRMVPLLWPGVLVNERLGCLAYQFARSTVEAAEEIAHGRLDPTVEKIASALRVLYEDRDEARDPMGSLVRSCISTERVARGLTSLPPSANKELLAALLSEGAHPQLLASTSYTRAYMHGDLHTGNVMLGEPSVLIDFAWARSGPIAVDAAKLVSDLLLRSASMRAAKIPTLGRLPRQLRPLQKVYGAKTGDGSIFTLALKAFLAEALGYDTVSNDTKTWVVKTLGESR